MAEALVGKELSDLSALFAARGEPVFRARQLYHALYRERVDEVAAITTFPKALRRELGDEFETGLPGVESRFESVDGTVRYLLALADGTSVEAVFIPEQGPRHAMHLVASRLSGRLQVLSDGADGHRAQSDGRRDRGAGPASDSRARPRAAQAACSTS